MSPGTNNFYDKSETYHLPVNELLVAGEIENPGMVDFSSLPIRSVFVKEALLDTDGTNHFTGAFRYDGYSLFDILNHRIIKKANEAEFSSIIDLFVEIENKYGDIVVFSWGEIFYPYNLHRIIIAGSVSRIVPSRTKELWVLPEESRIVSGNDLLTERNISKPAKLTVRSYPVSFKTIRGMTPLYSEGFRLISGNKDVGIIRAVPEGIRNEVYNTVFYGRGRGIHSTTPFKGSMLKDIIFSHFPISRDRLRSGILCISGTDGYRCAISYSEMFNRNDQQEFLLVKFRKGEDGGLFRIFTAADFFSDRAVKSVTQVRLDY